MGREGGWANMADPKDLSVDQTTDQNGGRRYSFVFVLVTHSCFGGRHPRFLFVFFLPGGQGALSSLCRYGTTSV